MKVLQQFRCPPDQTESPYPTENLDIHTLTVTY